MEQNETPIVAQTRNPKRVAAGKADAAARKAKQDRLLAELQASKRAYAPEPEPEREPEPVVPSAPLQAPEPRHTSHLDPWVLGGLGVAGIASIAWLLRARSLNRRPVSNRSERRPDGNPLYNP